jgi:argininosuccinate lyase
MDVFNVLTWRNEKSMNHRNFTPIADSDAKTANKLWGGRYEMGASQILEDINASVDFDHRLAQYDIEGSIAHANMLEHVGILTAEDSAQIQRGLLQIAEEVRSGTFEFKRELEDVHMNVEFRLQQIIGSAAGRLHTARSRNDQVALDFKMWTRAALESLDEQLSNVVDVLLQRAQQHHADIMPGFTHLQCAQPITFGHHLMAYVEMFLRDRSRVKDALARISECPLGAAALAGTSYPIDSQFTASALGFARPCRNSIDAVSDRDFALDYLFAASTVSMHLSRLAEELIIWSTTQFGFARLPEQLTAGSSIMPQKRNPDPAELIRAKSARVFGNLQTLLVVLKGLPLAYFKDMQEDKEPVFDTADSLRLCLRAMTAIVEGLEVNTMRMRSDATSGFATATDLADWLVRGLGLPFREAHGITGRIVRLAEATQLELHELTLEQMQTVDPRIQEDGLKALDVDRATAARLSAGGTSPVRVLEAISEAKQRNTSRN